jgi:hypothetical protein
VSRCLPDSQGATDHLPRQAARPRLGIFPLWNLLIGFPGEDGTV